MATDLQQYVSDFKRFAPAIIDSYFIVDRERRIVDFNHALFAMLPRQIARGLKGKKYYDVIQYDIGECIVQQVWTDNRHLRFDEIAGHVIGSEGARLRFILSAVPIGDAGSHAGALILQRDVTDEAEVQVKYQDMLETEARERERLATQIRRRTRELLDTNQQLLKTQQELLAYKKGLAL